MSEFLWNSEHAENQGFSPLLNPFISALQCGASGLLKVIKAPASYNSEK